MKITVIQTGSIETWMHLLAHPLKNSEHIRIAVPVTCCLLESGKGKILFDTGQKPLPYPQDRNNSDFYVRISPEETAVQKLAAMKTTPGDLDFIVLSHSHGDHADGLEDFPDVKVIVQKQALPLLKKFKNTFIPIEGEFDVFNDGSAICIPTPGHSPGHQSLLVRLDDGSRELLLGDAVYFPEALDHEPDSAEYAWNPDFFDSIRNVRSMRNSGVKIRFSHIPFHRM